jgi:hypothetical protein
MGSFVQFMQGTFGRLLRIAAGLAIIGVGVLLVGGTWGIVLTFVGAIPLLAGLMGICLVAPIFGYDLTGRRLQPPTPSPR